jgi:hypothetical protein
MTQVNSAPTYIVGGDMSDDVFGAWFEPGVHGELLVDADWGAAGAPVGTLTLQYSQDGGARINTVPGATFSANPNGSDGEVQQRFTGLHIYKRLRIAFVHVSDGLGNTTLNVRRDII